MSREAPAPGQVEGYAEAAARGLLPRTGPLPPKVHDGVSAGTQAVRWTLFSLVAFFGFIVFALLMSKAFPSSTAVTVFIGGGSAVVLAGIWASWGRVGRRALREYQAGYATLVLQEGVFWMGSLRPWRNAATRVLWDYGATWVLDRRTGEVLSPPRAGGTPPGMYPSPQGRERWELWTGQMWTGVLGSRPDL